MIKSIVSSAALAIAIAIPATAAAQGAGGGDGASGSCPPGSWFCAEAPQQEATPAGKAVQPLQPLPDPETAPPAPAGTVTKEPPPPPVVVYQPPPPVVIVRPGPEAPPPYEYERPVRHAVSPPQEWGLNFHLEGAAIGRGSSNAQMGGAGFGLRYKPTRHFGLEADLDFVGGTDYHGDDRSEVAGTFNALLFLNPRSRAQLYLLAGFGWSGAHVTSAALDEHYGYFGGQAGGGLEIRLSRSFALDADVRGFLRGRTDDLAQAQPEFSSNGRTTNTSAGALFTAGLTLYF